MRAACLTALMFFLLGSPEALPQAAENRVREVYDSGRVKAEYRVDSEGKIDGIYHGWFEDGRKRIVASYVHGVLDGTCEAYYENGRLAAHKKYQKGAIEKLKRFEPDGSLLIDVTVSNGRVALRPPGSTLDVDAYPKDLAALKDRLLEIEGPVREFETAARFAEDPLVRPPFRAGRLKDDYLENGLRHLNAYRFLAGLNADVALDPSYNDFAQHAALVCAGNGTISHTPRKPAGIDPAVFAKGARGAGSSNLSLGSSDIRDSIDGFMDDSDPSNIAAVGHRAWLLNPRMKRVGFGEVKHFHALWAHDGSGMGSAPPLLAYPALGWFPSEYLSPRAAWSLAYDTSKYTVPRNTMPEIRVHVLDRDFDVLRELTLDYKKPRQGRYGMGQALIFRPVLPADAPLDGLRFLVTIQGIKTRKSEAPLQYLVEFFRLREKKE